MTDLFEYDRWPSGEPYDWAGAARGPHAHDNIDFHLDLGCGKVKKGRIGVDRYPAPGVNVVADLDTLDTYAIAPEPGRDAVDLDQENPSGGRCDVFHIGQTAAGAVMPPYRYGFFPGYPRRYEMRSITASTRKLPFDDSSIESIISHHALEHIGDGFIQLMDECYRILRPGGVFRAIVPLFPSWAAMSDPDHKRYFLAEDGGFSTFDSFCGTPGETPQNCFLASFSVPYTEARFEKIHQDMTRRLDDMALWWTWQDARELRVTLRAVK